MVVFFWEFIYFDVYGFLCYGFNIDLFIFLLIGMELFLIYCKYYCEYVSLYVNGIN